MEATSLARPRITGHRSGFGTVNWERSLYQPVHPYLPCRPATLTARKFHAHRDDRRPGDPDRCRPFVETGQCFCWLHTHAPDGIIHIESPVQRTFTLGNFVAEWGQPLSASAVGPATGHVTALYNGKVFTGNPRDIPLTAHARLQLEVGSPLVGPEAITFPNGL